MRQLLYISAIFMLCGCAPSRQPSAYEEKIIVEFVEVVDGINGNQHRTYKSDEITKISIQMDDKLLHISIDAENGRYKKHETYHYPADALVKYVTKNK